MPDVMMTVTHLLAASTGEQRFERVMGSDTEAKGLEAAFDLVRELVKSGEPVTIWQSTHMAPQS